MISSASQKCLKSSHVSHTNKWKSSFIQWIVSEEWTIHKKIFHYKSWHDRTWRKSNYTYNFVFKHFACFCFSFCKFSFIYYVNANTQIVCGSCPITIPSPWGHIYWNSDPLLYKKIYITQNTHLSYHHSLTDVRGHITISNPFHSKNTTRNFWASPYAIFSMRTPPPLGLHCMHCRRLRRT